MILIRVLIYLLNFFFLDRNPRRCASYHGDKHLNKMQLEYAQIASTVMWHLHAQRPFLKQDEKIYKATHKNHPMVKWACQSRSHVAMVIQVGLALAEEKKSRAQVAQLLGKTWKTEHKSTPVLQWIWNHLPDSSYFEAGAAWTDPPSCMPECLRQKGGDVVECYRLYYTGHKVRLVGLSWRPYAEEPWFLEGCRQRLERMPDVQEDMEKEEKKKSIATAEKQPKKNKKVK